MDSLPMHSGQKRLALLALLKNPVQDKIRLHTASPDGRDEVKGAMRPLDLAGNLIFNKPFIDAYTTIYLRLIAWGTPS
jgi:hypothetical protein